MRTTEEKVLTSCRRALSPLLHGQQNDANHFVPRSWLAGPDFALAGGLVGEHFDAAGWPHLSQPTLPKLRLPGLRDFRRPGFSQARICGVLRCGEAVCLKLRMLVSERN
jgi:hypothetical protein